MTHIQPSVKSADINAIPTARLNVNSRRIAWENQTVNNDADCEHSRIIIQQLNVKISSANIVNRQNWVDETFTFILRKIKIKIFWFDKWRRTNF